MEKVLFVSSFIGLQNSGGSVAALRNLELCKLLFSKYETEAYGFRFKELMVNEHIKFLPSNDSKLKTLINYSLGNAGGLTFSNLVTLQKLIRRNKYPFVFLDGSLLGRLAKYIKQRNPETVVVVFFHNVEKDLFKQTFGASIVYKTLQKSAGYNEKLSARYSDYIICFNTRDAFAIEKYYGVKTDAIFPVTVNDRFDERLIKQNEPATNETAVKLLFVGSDFAANKEGLIWFLKEVMPNINAELIVLGRGMEKYRESWEGLRVKVIGTVENTDLYYYNTDAVIGPIFIGSGMKVKTAEALMMGKTFLGTGEAWEGYDEKAKETGFVCNTSIDFINAINSLTCSGKEVLNKAARKIYEDLYSPHSQLQKVQQLKEKISGND